MDLTTQEQEMLTVLNQAWKLLPPVRYDTFNTLVPCSGKDSVRNEFALLGLEQEHPKLGIREISDPVLQGKVRWGVSVLSILATISDYLCGKRLCAIVETGSDGIRYIVSWDFVSE